MGAYSGRSVAPAVPLSGDVTVSPCDLGHVPWRPCMLVTPGSPPAFERLLDERGYVVDTEAVVMVAGTLHDAAVPTAPEAIALAPAQESPDSGDEGSPAGPRS